MYEHLLIEHHFEGAGQYGFLHVAAGLSHFVGALGMVDGDDILGDDGTLAELLVDEMRYA